METVFKRIAEEQITKKVREIVENIIIKNLQYAIKGRKIVVGFRGSNHRSERAY